MDVFIAYPNNYNADTIIDELETKCRNSAMKPFVIGQDKAPVKPFDLCLLTFDKSVRSHLGVVSKFVFDKNLMNNVAKQYYLLCTQEDQDKKTMSSVELQKFASSLKLQLYDVTNVLNLIDLTDVMNRSAPRIDSFRDRISISQLELEDNFTLQSQPQVERQRTSRLLGESVISRTKLSQVGSAAISENQSAPPEEIVEANKSRKVLHFQNQYSRNHDQILQHEALVQQLDKISEQDALQRERSFVASQRISNVLNFTQNINSPQSPYKSSTSPILQQFKLKLLYHVTVPLQINLNYNQQRIKIQCYFNDDPHAIAERTAVVYGLSPDDTRKIEYYIGTQMRKYNYMFDLSNQQQYPSDEIRKPRSTDVLFKFIHGGKYGIYEYERGQEECLVKQVEHDFNLKNDRYVEYLNEKVISIGSI